MGIEADETVSAAPSDSAEVTLVAEKARADSNCAATGTHPLRYEAGYPAQHPDPRRALRRADALGAIRYPRPEFPDVGMGSASQPVGISGERVGEDLQRDVAAELGVCGAIDLPHAPLADEGGHVVMAEAVTDGQSHELCW